MKLSMQTASNRIGRALVLAGASAIVMTTLACSSNSRTATSVAQPVGAVTPASANSGTENGVTPASAKGGQMGRAATAVPVKAATKPIVYRSRDYGVSFVYPWQYAYFSARTVANGDAVLRPKADGHEGQITLARVEVPKGFYPDTNFERGYFTLSLNQSLDEEQCVASLTGSLEAKLESESINGVEFRWVESDSGGRGSSAKVRNYAGFTNGACYELELGVRTANRDGLAREVEPDHVMRRLEAILRSVEIKPSLQSAPQVASATAEPPEQD